MVSWRTASSGLHSRAATRGSFGPFRLVFVGDEFRLHGDEDEVVDRLDDVLDGGHAALARDTSRVDRTATCLPAGDFHRACAPGCRRAGPKPVRAPAIGRSGRRTARHRRAAG